MNQRNSSSNQSSVLKAITVVSLLLLFSTFSAPSSSTDYINSKSKTEEDEIEFFVLEIPDSVGEGFEPHILVGPGIDGEEWLYIDSPTGLGSGLSGNLWISKDGGDTWEFKQTGRPPTNWGGSGDSYTAVFSDGTIVYTDLYGFTVTADTSFNGGDTWVQNPLASIPWLDDRQWFEIGPTVGTGDPQTLYLTYNSFGPIRGFYIQKSQFTAAGLGWIPGNAGLPITTSTGSRDYFIVDRNDGTLYLPNNEGGSLVVYVSDDGANSFSRHEVLETIDDIQNIFVVTDVDNAGNVYLTWTDKYNVFMAVSQDRAENWEISQVTDTIGSRVLPWIVGGDAGRIGITWYESATEGDSDVSEEMDNATWDVKGALCIDALSENRTFLITTIMENVHTGTIKTTGASDQPADRDLGDFFTNDVDSMGRMVLTFGKDGDDGANQYQAAVMFGEQIDGPFLLENMGPIANFTYETKGLKVFVDGSESIDLNGKGIDEYIWDFGDGTNGTGETAEHEYNKSGEYEVTLRVINKDGLGNKTSQDVVVEKRRTEFNPLLILLILVLILGVAALAYLFLIRNKGGKNQPVPVAPET
ncbi:MAG: PKD domain-containing protein [Thermoplasmata archaeon]|nr:MAG: PKD domain-containing protein [Thermoplasmata archaeon]